VISPETIALVRDRTDILAVIGEGVPSLKRRGRSWVGLCPFHKEKTPSFHVNPDRGFFHCFGCKESGSAIDFLMKAEGYTFPEAVRALAERAGIPIEETRTPQQTSEADRLKRAREDLYAVNALAATYWEEQLRKHEMREYALEELAKRALVPGSGDAKIDDALQAFRIGYAPPGWDGLTSFLKAQSISPVAAETVGLLVPRSSGSGFYDRFRHRLMFAVMDPQGRVVAFSGRALREIPGTESERAGDRGGPPPKYVNSPESPIYTKGQMLFGIHQARHAVRQAERAVLVEGNFDVLSLHARGLTNVVAPLGTAFTMEQAKLLKRFAGEVVLLFDGDEAGRKAARLSREAVREAGMSARIAQLPEGKDPDELSRDRGVRAIEELVSGAKGMLEALLDMALDEAFVSADAYERAARVTHVMKLISEEEDPLVRSMAKAYADQLAGRLDIVRVGGDSAFQALEQSVKQSLARADAERRAREARTRSEADHDEHGRGGTTGVGERSRISGRPPGSPERTAIVGYLIECPALLDDPEVAAELAMLEGPSIFAVSTLRRCWNSAENRLDVDAFMAAVPDSIRSFAARRLADPQSDDESQAKGFLLDNANKLKRLLLSQEAARIARDAERPQGDFESKSELLREAADRLRTKHGLDK
jgi:DNA primase